MNVVANYSWGKDVRCVCAKPHEFGGREEKFGEGKERLRMKLSTQYIAWHIHQAFL